MKISVTNCDYFVLNLPIKARRKTSKRCLKNILFWAAVTGVDSVKRENTGLNHNILQWWMMILIQPEWESATPNQPADRCRTDWFMPRVAYINQLSAGNGSWYAEVNKFINLRRPQRWPGDSVRAGQWGVRSGGHHCVLTCPHSGVGAQLALPSACVVTLW